MEAVKPALQAAAQENKGNLLFITVDGGVEDNLRILEYFGVTVEELPAIRVIDLDNDMAKFMFEGEITADAVKAFAASVLDGSAKRHFKSEPVPEDWDAEPVKVLTGANFEEVALNTETHAFVEFYAPWCGHCKQLAPIWDKLGEKFEGADNVVIAKVDATANELPDVHVQSFPTIYFFPAGEDAEPMPYEGGRTVAAFAEFLKEQTGVAVELSEEELAEADAEEGDEGDYEAYYEDYEEEEEAAAAEGHDEL
jgi:protein disulfide-isomerase A1